MFDKNQHKIIMVKILKEIYSDPELRNILGFKGGTAAFLFYGLPRISVDLDFDLLEEKKKTEVLDKLKKTLPRFGNLIEATEKRYTLFFILSYQKGERKIKIEISKRLTGSKFSLKNYLGIPVLLINKEDMMAGKFTAFLTRKKFASRDLFDLWFFLKNDWEINEELLEKKTDFTLRQALKEAIKKVTGVKQNQLLQGLGELLDERQKPWVRENLKKEVLFFLRFWLKEKTGS